MTRIVSIGVLVLCASAHTVKAQGTPASTISGRPIRALSYGTGGGTTKVDLKSPDGKKGGSGEAVVEAKGGTIAIDVRVDNLPNPSAFGAQLLTCILWGVSTEGRPANLGEIRINAAGRGELKTTTQLQVFSLIVTAEPYFAVERPGEVVLLENAIPRGSRVKSFPVGDYQMVRKAQYDTLGNPLALAMDLKNVPLDMYEGRNAVEIAKSLNAGTYAPEIFNRAESSLMLAERALARKADKNEIVSSARQAVQFAEDAISVTAEREEKQRIARNLEATVAQAKADAEAKAAKEAAEQAELARAREAELRAESEAADIRARTATAQADAFRAKQDAAREEAERSRNSAQELRLQLFDQFTRIVDTRDTPRGLVLNIGDVLFDTGQYELRPAAREVLDRFSAIVLMYPGLNFSVEGHTDNTGSDETNQKLSEQRAGVVRTYLIGQGLSSDKITARGFGGEMPIADNDTASGRQKNRRVEIVVSGDVIGTSVSH